MLYLALRICQHYPDLKLNNLCPRENSCRKERDEGGSTFSMTVAPLTRQLPGGRKKKLEARGGLLKVSLLPGH